jgi:protein-S-isoprenylcysteine O-methyltransferase Ste14
VEQSFKEGIMKSKRVLPPTYLLVSIVVMVALHFLLPVTTIIPLPWNVIGIVPLALGIAINIVADSALRKADTTVKPFEESSALVTSGAYRISRHPMYLGFVLVLIGVALLMGSLAPYIVIPAFVVLMDRVFIQVEERMLEARFGGTWQAYKLKTRRWI